MVHPTTSLSFVRLTRAHSPTDNEIRDTNPHDPEIARPFPSDPQDVTNRAVHPTLADLELLGIPFLS
jgi:hypothetical protein